MKKTLWGILLFWATSAMKGLQENQSDNLELARLKASLLYVQMVKTFRLLFMSV